ncbi:uncharacterized protein LOC124263211 [Haliotis rubra]|uniref:uncharacterized protein LOC124263211 n=1 Tax=Haliotis rubra TaxID=36100 RepID=UPI001EE5B5EA|nr:uncharacterized protein LOC124263211 [Haliotis rubra]
MTSEMAFSFCRCTCRQPLVFLRTRQSSPAAPRTFCSKSKFPDIPEYLIKTGKRRAVREATEIGSVELFRKAMRKVPQQVVVVTSAQHTPDAGSWHKRGVTCSTFSSVSFAPPIISFCLHKHSRMHELLQQTEQFAVHVLGQDQIRHAIHFSTTATDDQCQFDKVPHFQGEEGLPIILGSLAVFLCGTHSVHTVGDHHVWYGTVHGTSISESQMDPLLYFTKSFRSISDEVFIKAFEDATLPFEDWTHEAHLRMAWNYLREYGHDGATPYIKLGIQKFNEQNKSKLKTGYHETLTLFFIHVVWDALQRCPGDEFEAFLQQSQHLVDKNLPFQYYNKDTLFREDARHKFVAPDKKSLP